MHRIDPRIVIIQIVLSGICAFWIFKPLAMLCEVLFLMSFLLYLQHPKEALRLGVWLSHRPAAALIFYTLLLCFKAPMRAFMSVWVPFVMCRNSLLRVAVPHRASRPFAPTKLAACMVCGYLLTKATAAGKMSPVAQNKYIRFFRSRLLRNTKCLTKRQTKWQGLRR